MRGEEVVCCYDQDRGLAMAGTDDVGGNKRASVCSWEGQGLMTTMLAFYLDDAGTVDDEFFFRAQPVRLLLCFGQRNHHVAHHPTNADNCEHTARFLRISTTYIEQLKARLGQEEHQYDGNRYVIRLWSNILTTVTSTSNMVNYDARHVRITSGNTCAGTGRPHLTGTWK